MKPRLFVATLTAFAAAGFAPSENDAARLEGEYALLPQADARACARACEEDGLCMSWAFAAAEGQCALSAVAPTSAPAGAVLGLSSRAPKFDWAPPPAASPPENPAAPIRQAAIRSPFEPTDPSAELLGGPDAASGLRLRFADDRP